MLEFQQNDKHPEDSILVKLDRTTIGVIEHDADGYHYYDCHANSSEAFESLELCKAHLNDTIKGVRRPGGTYFRQNDQEEIPESPTVMDEYEPLKQLFDDAYVHGCDSVEPNQEADDLQAILRAAWNIMSAEQRKELGDCDVYADLGANG